MDLDHSKSEVSPIIGGGTPHMGGASGVGGANGMGRGILSSRGNNPWLTLRAPDPDPYLVVDNNWHYDRVRRL